MNNLTPSGLAMGMTDEIMEVIYKYEESVLLPTVLGILDVIKHDLIRQHMTEDDD